MRRPQSSRQNQRSTNSTELGQGAVALPHFYKETDMTLDECVQRIQEDKPSAYDDERICAWVNELEAQMQSEVLGITDVSLMKQYDITKSADREATLLIPMPFDQKTYIPYIEAQIDYADGEGDRYNNNVNIFNQYYNDFKAWYIEHNRPNKVTWHNFN